MQVNIAAQDILQKHTYYPCIKKDSSFAQYKGFIDFTFVSNRTVEINGVTSDSRIFCMSDTTSCSFIHKTDTLGNWYIFLDSTWLLFFDFEAKKINNTLIEKSNREISTYDTTTVYNTTLYGFKIYTINVLGVGGETGNIYWFCPERGIVMIENPSYSRYLVRDDFR